MSVDSVREDCCVEQECENRFSLPNMSFSGWMAMRVSFLSPHLARLRAIEDRGSISESLADSKIDLFNRVLLKESLFLKTARSVAAFVLAPVPIFCFAVAGTAYHGVMALKHFVVWLASRDAAADQQWKKLKQSADLFLVDGLWAALPIAATIASGGPGVLLFAGILGFSPLYIGMMAWCFIPRANERPGFYKSMMLRKEFGIVSAEGAQPLNWDPALDRDLVQNPHGVGLNNGYFGKLHKEQGRQFMRLIQDMQKLPAKAQYEFLYPPTARHAVNFLRKHAAISPSDMETFETNFNALEAQMKQLQELMFNRFALSQRDTRWTTYYMDFPLTESECASYLKETRP